MLLECHREVRYKYYNPDNWLCDGVNQEDQEIIPKKKEIEKINYNIDYE